MKDCSWHVSVSQITIACDLPRGVWAVWFYSLTPAHHEGNGFSRAFFLNENVLRTWAALCPVIWTIFHHSPVYYVWKFIWDDEKAKLQTGLQPWGNISGILFTDQGDEICPLWSLPLDTFLARLHWGSRCLKCRGCCVSRLGFGKFSQYETD